MRLAARLLLPPGPSADRAASGRPGGLRVLHAGAIRSPHVADGRWVTAVDRRLLALLVKSRVEYQLTPHREAFAAREVAHTAHVRGRRLVKVAAVGCLHAAAVGAHS